MLTYKCIDNDPHRKIRETIFRLVFKRGKEVIDSKLSLTC